MTELKWNEKNVRIVVPHVRLYTPQGIKHAVVEVNLNQGEVQGTRYLAAYQYARKGWPLHVRLISWPEIVVSWNGLIVGECRPVWQHEVTEDGVLQISLRPDACINNLQRRLLKDGSAV